MKKYIRNGRVRGFVFAIALFAILSQIDKLAFLMGPAPNMAMDRKLTHSAQTNRLGTE